MQIAERFQAHTSGVTILHEDKPGKSAALATGIAAVKTPFIATADADTYYPPDYIKNAATLFSNGGDTVVAVLAFPAIRENNGQTFGMRHKNKIAVQLMPRQTHSGGYGQSFRTSALKAVGGFTAEIWPYCLMDHEIIHRLTKYQNNKARVLYDSNHWCAPSTRRVDRSKVRWTLSERLLYHVTPFQYRDWFFYSFLKSKFDARGVSELNLRRKEWINPTDQVPT